ncbi:MAG: serine hydrolase domain-containing protein, partial [Candidatus Kariarchaeaceae archaeon]
MKFKWLGIVLVLLSTSFVSGQTVESHEDMNPYNWSTAEAINYGFNPETIESYTEGLSHLRSVLVVRENNLIFEKYFHDGSVDTAYNVHSVSKSIISALVGIAVEQGLIFDLDIKMLSYFPEYKTENIDERMSNITLSHLLTMRAGFEFYELDSNTWIPYTASENWVEYIINLPLLYDPGSTYFYSTAHTHLLSAILTKVTGMSTYDYAMQYLFDPLSVS